MAAEGEPRLDKQGAGTLVLLARHVVVIVSVLALYAGISKFGGFLITWAGAIAVVFGVSALVAGLGLLFFTRAEKGKTATTFRNMAWLLATLLFLDPLVQTLNSGSAAPSAKTLGAPETMTSVVPTQHAAVEVPAAEIVEPKTATAVDVSNGPTEDSDACRATGKSLRERRATLAQMRRDYADAFVNLDDVGVAQAMHLAFYPDLPLKCVAYALGVELPLGSR